MQYYALARDIIAVPNEIKEDEESTLVYQFDGNAVKMPTEVIHDHYRKVHIDETLESYYEGIDKKVFDEMKNIYDNINSDFDQPETIDCDRYINYTLKDNN